MMHHRRRSLLMDRRRRRRRVHVVLRLALRCGRKSLRRRIVLPLCLWRRWRTVIIGAPYRFRRGLMLVASAVEIASAITSVPRSRLLVHYFWIAVSISSAALITSVRLWLWWRIISPRHSCHIVIGIDAPVASVSVEPPWCTVIDIAVDVPASNGTNSFSTSRRFRMISHRSAIDNSPVRRRNWRMKSRRHIHQPRPAIPSVPATRRPAPAASVHKYPAAIAIRHPAPRI